MAFEFFQPGSMRSARISSGGILMTMASPTAKRQAIRIRLSEDVMRRLRWIAGDSVLIGFDSTAKLIRIKRVPKGGYTLTPQDRKEGRGKIGASSFQVLVSVFPAPISSALIDSLKRAPYQTDDYFTDADGLTFDWPK